MTESILLEEGDIYNVGDFFTDNTNFVLRRKRANIGNGEVDDEISFYVDENKLLAQLKAELLQIKELECYSHGDADYQFRKDYFYITCTATTDHVNDHYQSIEVDNLTVDVISKIRDLLDEIYKEPEPEPEPENTSIIVEKPFILPACRST